MTKRRWKDRRRDWYIKWLPQLSTLVLKLLFATLRCRIQVSDEVRDLLKSDKPVVVAFWHGRLILMPLIYQRVLAAFREAWILSSQHWDGELIARIAALFGVHAVRGSSTRGWMGAFRSMKKLVVGGSVIAITPDGPRGPRYRVKPGIIAWARHSGASVVPVSWSARSRLRFGSWDRFMLPLPFARVSVVFGEPMSFGKGKGGDLEAASRVVEQKLNLLTAKSSAMVAEDSRKGWFFLVYNLLLYLVGFLGLPFFAWKLMTVPKHRVGFRQRFGFYKASEVVARRSKKPLWVHAVSVGEVLATVPFVRRVVKAYPEVPVIISTITLTGQEAARKIFPEADAIVYFPIDFPFSIGRALRRARPQVFIHTETEIWPNFLFMLARRRIPSVIINGRISERSCRQYGWFRFFFRSVLSSVCVFGMQSRADCLRIIKIGAEPGRVFVTGNMKFDYPTVPGTEENVGEIRQEMGLPPAGLLFVAGSTHCGEESIVLEVFRKLKKDFPELKLLLAPRHGERFGEVGELVRREGFSVERRTQRKMGQGCSDAEVLLLDTMGELARAYSMADLVFVGGSLVPIGGHNLLEPVMFKKAVLFGPHTQTCIEMANALKRAGGGIEVSDGASLYREAERLLRDASIREGLGQAGYSILQEHRGAADRNLAVLGGLLDRD